MELKNTINQLVEKYYEKVVAVRRHLHQNPELSYQEYETSKYIISILDSLNIKYQRGIAKTGIVAMIEGKNPTKKIMALRADMDALPIEEKNNIPYKSINTGVMHACGHDAHTASVIGVIFILNELKDQFEGTVKIIFQPSEEKLPGGAKQMIEEGVLDNPAPEFILAQHVYPELNTGKVGFKTGTYMASTDELYFTIKGKGGHAAMPERITNTVFIAAQIIIRLQEIPNQIAPKDIPTVLTIGKVIANGATNVVPDEVYLEGTFRTFNEEWRTKAHQEIHRIANQLSTEHKVTIDVNIKHGYPVLINNVQTTQWAMQYAKDYLGNDQVESLELRMTAEDFSYFSQEIPATFYRLGTTEQNQDYIPLHSPNFNIDESSLKTGMGLMAYIAIQYLKQEGC